MLNNYINLYLDLGIELFCIGFLGVIINRNNLIILLMSIELILLGCNLNFIIFSHYLGEITGQVFALLVLTVAAAEAAVGLAILVVYFRIRGSIEVDKGWMMKS